MPENPIHPGRNSTNTSKVPPETNLGQSALKSCLIYTHFSLALKPSVPMLHPLPSPTGQGAPALSHPTRTPPSPAQRGSSLLSLGRAQRETLESFLPSQPLSFLKCPVLQKMWHQPGYDNVTCPAGKSVSGFGQAFSEITLPSRKPSLFWITRW